MFRKGSQHLLSPVQVVFLLCCCIFNVRNGDQFMAPSFSHTKESIMTALSRMLSNTSQHLKALLLSTRQEVHLNEVSRDNSMCLAVIPSILMHQS